MSFSDAYFYTGYQLQADAGTYLIAAPEQWLIVDLLQLADGRSIHIAAESRTVAIEKEDRVISAGGPDSAIIVGTERRTINVLKELA